MARSFVDNSLRGRVVFGAGSLAELGREIEALGARRALTPGCRARGARE